MHIKTLVPGNFLILLFVSLSLSAQTPIQTGLPHSDKIVHALLQSQEQKKHDARDAAKSTAVTAERLIATSIYDYYTPDSIMGISDTSAYYYSNGRGSMFNYNSMSFNTNWLYGPFDYGYGRGINTLGTGVVTEIRPNYFLQVSCDSSHEFYYEGGDTAGHHYTAYDTLNTYETYNNADNITYFNAYVGQNQSSLAFSWDGNGNNTETVYLSYYPLSDTLGADIHIFNNSDQLVEDSIMYYSDGTLQPSVRLFYTYDGVGNLVYASALSDSLGSWPEFRRWNIYYNADNLLNLDSISIRLTNTNTWVGDGSDSFGYTTGVGYYTYRCSKAYNDSTYSIVNGMWVNEKHVNSAGLPDTLYNSSTDYILSAPSLFTHAYKQAFIYDSYNNPVTALQYYYNVTNTITGTGYYNTSPDITNHYYYNTYLSSMSVKNISTGERITVFPNPSAGLYNISVSSGLIYAYAIVYNELGQSIFCIPINSANTQINLSTQPSGIYYVQIKDKSGALLKTERIGKL